MTPGPDEARPQAPPAGPDGPGPPAAPTPPGPRTDEAGPAVDRAGQPVEDDLSGLEQDAGRSAVPTSSGILDRGAIFAGWVGLGMALVIAIAFELILAVQPLVFLVAPIAGVLIGMYANQRSERWRPRGRLLVNAGYAGLVTGVGLAVMYVGLRLLFVYADSGFRPEGLGGQLDCATGPECFYERLLDEGLEDQLVEAGIVDAPSFEAAVLREQATGALWIVGLTLGGALGAGVVRSVRRPPRDASAAAAAASARGD